MFTVIVYWKDQKDAEDDTRNRTVSLEEYNFLFDSVRFSKELVIIPYPLDEDAENDGDSIENQFIKYLDDQTNIYHKWKLIIFDGRLIREDKYLEPEFIRRDWADFLDSLFCLNPNKEREEHSLPSEVWILNCYGYNQSGAWKNYKWHLCHHFDAGSSVDGTGGNPIEFVPIHFEGQDNELQMKEMYKIPSLRLLSMAVDLSSRNRLNYEYFKAVCGVLLLSVNDISPVLIMTRYVYEFSVEIDHEKFVSFVEELYNRNQELCYALEEEKKKYLLNIHTRTSFHELNFKAIELEDVLDDKREILKIFTRDLKHAEKISLILNENQNWINDRLYFTQANLHKLIEYTGNAESEGGVSALNDAGTMKVKAKIDSALFRILSERKKPDNPEMINSMIQKEVNNIRKQVSYRSNPSETGLMYFIISCVTSISLFGVIFSIEVISDFEAKLRMWLPAINSWLLFRIGEIGLLTVLVCILLHVALWVNAKFRCKYYEYVLKTKVLCNRDKKVDMIHNIVDSIQTYKSYWIYQNKYRQVAARQKKFETRLVHHADTVRQHERMCHIVYDLLGNSAPLCNDFKPEKLVINYEKEPEEVDEYWLHDYISNQYCNINHTGICLQNGLPFIPNINLVRAIKYENDEHIIQ